MDWKNPDIHARSREISEAIKLRFPDLPTKINALEPKYDIARRKVLELFPGDANVASLLGYCDARRKTNDRDLLGITCGGALTMAFCLVAHSDYEPSIVCAFKDTLYDMGHTCLQGYTHRLVIFIMAMMGDMEDNDEETTDRSTERTTTTGAVPPSSCGWEIDNNHPSSLGSGKEVARRLCWNVDGGRNGPAI